MPDDDDRQIDSRDPRSSRSRVGVSAGSDVVCCAVLTTTDDGAESFDYRTVTAEGSRTDIGDLVATSLDLASEHLVRGEDHGRGGSEDRSGIAVAHRSDSVSRSILSATRRHHVTADDLVLDVDATLCWLRHTGEVSRYRSVLVVDVGASGTSVSVVDQIDGTVHASSRTDDVGGAVFDARLLSVVSRRLPAATTTDRVIEAARLRTAKEQLSFHESVTVDLGHDETLTVTRDEFVRALAGPIGALRDTVVSVIDTVPGGVRPEVVAVVGGGAHVPAVVDAVARAANVPVLPVVEPDAVIAKGAALLARTLTRPAFPPSHPTLVAGRMRSVGLLAAACAAMAIVLAYGVDALTPSTEPSVPTVATSSLVVETTPDEPAPEAPPALTGGYDDPTPAPGPWPTTDYTYTAPSEPYRMQPYPARTSAPTATTPAPTPVEPPTSSTPTLYPAPDLPVIVLPEIPPWWNGMQPPTTPPAATTSPDAPPTDPSPDPSTPAPPTPTTPTPSAPASQPNVIEADPTPTATDSPQPTP